MIELIEDGKAYTQQTCSAKKNNMRAKSSVKMFAENCSSFSEK